MGETAFEPGQKDQENLLREMGKTFLEGDWPGQGLESNIVLRVMRLWWPRNPGGIQGTTQPGPGPKAPWH